MQAARQPVSRGPPCLRGPLGWAWSTERSTGGTTVPRAEFAGHPTVRIYCLGPVSSMLRRTPVRFALLVVLGFAGDGCGSVEPAPEAGPEGHGSFALLRVERSRFDGPMLTERFEHFEVGGRVVRFSGLAREEAAWLLGAEDLLEPEDVDSCEAPTSVLLRDDAASDPHEGADIELVDVGVIDVRSPERAFALEPQSFPGLMSLLQGAIYGTTEGEGVAWQSGVDWTFGAKGASGIGPFEVSADAPDELVVLRIGPDDPTMTAPTVERALDLPVRWEAGQREDVVRIELAWTQLGTEMRLRCAATDDGSFSVPASLLRQLPDASLVGSLRVAVTRERRRPFGATGLDEGVLLVSLAETFEARLR